MNVNAPKRFLTTCLGVLFLVTGLYRTRLLYKYPPSDHRSPSYEIVHTFKSPHWLRFAIIVTEITVGLLLLFSTSEQTKTYVIYFISAMLTASVLVVITTNWKKVISTFDDVWTFHPTTVAVTLHVTYLFVTVSLLL